MNAAADHECRQAASRAAVKAALKAGARGDEAEWHRLAAKAKAIREGRPCAS